jgi:hypothetical protein
MCEIRKYSKSFDYSSKVHYCLALMEAASFYFFFKNKRYSRNRMNAPIICSKKYRYVVKKGLKYCGSILLSILDAETSSV